MDESNYDEFGNYIGPGVDSDDSDDDRSRGRHRLQHTLVRFSFCFDFPPYSFSLEWIFFVLNNFLSPRAQVALM